MALRPYAVHHRAVAVQQLIDDKLFVDGHVHCALDVVSEVIAVVVNRHILEIEAGNGFDDQFLVSLQCGYVHRLDSADAAHVEVNFAADQAGDDIRSRNHANDEAVDVDRAIFVALILNQFDALASDFPAVLIGAGADGAAPEVIGVHFRKRNILQQMHGQHDELLERVEYRNRVHGRLQLHFNRIIVDLTHTDAAFGNLRALGVRAVKDVHQIAAAHGQFRIAGNLEGPDHVVCGHGRAIVPVSVLAQIES